MHIIYYPLSYPKYIYLTTYWCPIKKKQYLIVCLENINKAPFCVFRFIIEIVLLSPGKSCLINQSEHVPHKKK